MTSPKHAEATEAGRFYRNLPGFEELSLASVTNTVNVKSKPAIAPWAAKLAALRAVGCEAEWHAVQQEEGDEAAAKWIARASKEDMDRKAAIGSAVHLCAELWDSDHVTVYKQGIGLSLDLTARLDGVLEKAGGATGKNLGIVQNHLEQYARFIDEWKPIFRERERTVFSVTGGYAGTLDAIVDLPGEDGAMRRYVLDIKTGGVYADSVGMQLAAYRYAEYIVRGDKSLPFTFGIDGGVVLQLKPKSYKVHFVRCDEYAYESFLAAKRLWLWANEGSKGAMGDEWR